MKANTYNSAARELSKKASLLCVLSFEHLVIPLQFIKEDNLATDTPTSAAATSVSLDTNVAGHNLDLIVL
jgi:hypothetical protein